ncbi:MAG: ABC transporter ATP-binding protein [Elusimicrobia bacterium]|nr:ABC transporter ATP-binding protein [Elusimicrobiota bacterium]
MPTLRMEGVTFRAGGSVLLHEASLAFRSGELTAVIGPSGCGKSTLLKCLTTTHRPAGGRVTLDGKDVWEMRGPYRLALGYVPQDDVIHPQLTVAEAFEFSSGLRLDTDLPPADVRRRIGSTAAALGLAAAKDRRIRRLSGGQRKRVNIGIELLAEPQVLILDEPASGLDPGTEEDLVKLLSCLARGGRTVVTTTHSMEYLAAFDRIVMLAAGWVVFCGTRPELLAHFGVAHEAEVFKAVRAKPAESWAALYRRSPLAAQALRN